MAIFRNGVKMGKFESNWRTGLSKKRGQGILRKIGILEDDKGRKKHEKDAKGEMQTIRTIVGRGEGFQHPVNFKVRFGMPKGIDQQTLSAAAGRTSWSGGNTGKVKSGGLDWKTHIMNSSTKGEMKRRFDAAKQVSSSPYKPGDTVMERSETTKRLLNLR